jgi:NADH-quinone oxidoreductase subunit F
MAERLYRANVLVCGGTGCVSSGSQEVMSALTKELKSRGLDNEVKLVQTGCRGFCAMGPVIIIYPEGIFYCQVRAADIPFLVEETLIKGRPVQRLLYKEPDTHQAVPFYRDIPFYSKQNRIVLGNCGLVNPEIIDEYIAQGGYAALSKALLEMSREDVVKEIKDSGLRGRGGAGFLTGLKWEFTAKAKGDVKYVVCNADEGDPGAFMDRSIIEGDPHSLVEGMAICGYAVGAKEGYVYCRAEYPLAIERLKKAIDQAKEYGLLGENILGTDFAFDLHVKEGAGAFVCGEETALIASLEGRRGEPRPRPPFPAISGLWGKPTNLNNVKSYAYTPRIIANGAEWFASIGPKRSPGTAVFALTGKVSNTGLVEVPMGITVGEIVFDIGGGVPKGKKFKAVQTGGPLGGCIPVQHLNVPIDFDSLKEIGAVMGSGGMIVVDEETCMVEFSKFFLTFAAAESCGKCVPCRVGGRRMLEILTRISEGKGKREDIAKIKELAAGMEGGALCALGQLTPGPVMAALRYFEDEFITHIDDRMCPAGSCQELVEARCMNACPAGIDVPTYISLTAQGHYAEALEVHRTRNPFALVCGRVCPAFCESHCRRGDIDEPIAIRSIKRYMADQELKQPWNPKVGPAKKEKVAVIGSGPAGLTAALRLRQMGYGVTIFEALPVAGGMMAVGIPDYRLPREILNEEINNVIRAGAELKLNAALGRDFTLEDLLSPAAAQSAADACATPRPRPQIEVGGPYQAVILAIGAHLSRKLGIPGEEAKGVYHGVYFLKDVALGKAPDLTGKRVVVVGGGNVAIDAARTAFRVGAAEVNVVYRRARADMPAYAEEIRAAEEEGCIIHYLTNPIEAVVDDGHIVAIQCQNQTLGDFDRSGRRRPVPVKGNEFAIDCDLLVPAIGQETDLSWLNGDGIATNRDTTFITNKALATSQPGVFAAGDNTSGPATIIEAVAQGNKVAVAVAAYLNTGKLVNPVYEPAYKFPEQLYNLDDYAEARRPHMPELEAAKRLRSWDEVELGLGEEAAREECKRCLRCDLEWLRKMDGQARPLADMYPVEAPKIPAKA